MVSIMLRYKRPSGNVASVGSGESITPTKAEVAIVNDVQDSIKPWQLASSRRFFLIMVRRSINAAPGPGIFVKAYNYRKSS